MTDAQLYVGVPYVLISLAVNFALQGSHIREYGRLNSPRIGFALAGAFWPITVPVVLIYGVRHAHLSITAESTLREMWWLWLAEKMLWWALRAASRISHKHDGVRVMRYVAGYFDECLKGLKKS